MKIAIIPARGGSKRIEKKNIKRFHGKPIIEYPISAALESGCFDKVVVSTDDEEIARIALAAGAEVPFMRPHELSTDYIATMDVIQHAIHYFDQSGLLPEYACCIYPATPLVDAQLIRDGFDLLCKSEKKYVVTVANYEHPVHRALMIDTDNKYAGLVPMFREFIGQRSQDLPSSCHDAGQFYWGHASAYRQGAPFFSGEAAPLFVENWKYVDIDTMEDWERAEQVFELIKKAKSNGYS